MRSVLVGNALKFSRTRCDIQPKKETVNIPEDNSFLDENNICQLGGYYHSILPYQPRESRSNNRRLRTTLSLCVTRSRTRVEHNLYLTQHSQWSMGLRVDELRIVILAQLFEQKSSVIDGLYCTAFSITKTVRVPIVIRVQTFTRQSYAFIANGTAFLPDREQSLWSLHRT